MSIEESRVEAFVDGELTPDEAALVEAAMAGDPLLAARVNKARALKAALGAAFDGALEEAPPERLLAAARGETPSRSAQVISLAERRTKKEAKPGAPANARWGAIAAGLAILIVGGGLFLARPSGGGGGGGLIGARPNGALEARGALAVALQDQLASSPRGDAPVRIGVSFQSHDGDYCRTFRTRQGAPTAGLACRDEQGWQVRVAMADTAPAATGTYQTAASGTPPPVADAMEAMIKGEALDADGEVRAKAAGWRGR